MQLWWIYTCGTSLALVIKLTMLFLISRTFTSRNWCPKPMRCQTATLHAFTIGLSSGVANRTYKSGLTAYMSFCSHFNMNPFPTTPLTLQYFCADRSQCISYKTLKVYLTAIRLMHTEQGLPDLTTDQLLHLACRGIHQQPTTPEHKRLPITIDILKVLKSQLHLSNYSAHEQHMLWSAFTLSFNGFLHASECLSLTWSDVMITDTPRPA